jgi:hypothetical protein
MVQTEQIHATGHRILNMCLPQPSYTPSLTLHLFLLVHEYELHCQYETWQTF